MTILADRGFGDVKLFGFLEELCFGYVIRFRGDAQVSAANAETRRAGDWLGADGRAENLRPNLAGEAEGRRGRVYFHGLKTGMRTRSKSLASRVATVRP